MSIFNFLLMISVLGLPLIAITLYLTWSIQSYIKKQNGKLFAAQIILPFVWFYLFNSLFNVDFLSAIVYPCIPLAVIPYGIWIIQAYRRKKKLLQLVILILAPFLWFGILLFSTKLEQANELAKRISNTYDVELDQLGTPLNTFATERAFNGDGYSLTIYKLPEKIYDHFSSADDTWLQSHPIWPDYRSHWPLRSSWQKSPIDNRYIDILNFALGKNAMYVRELPGIQPHIQAIETTLQQPGSFYAIAASMHSEVSVGDADLFIVDIKNKLLYIINHNT